MTRNESIVIKGQMYINKITFNLYTTDLIEGN